MLVVVFAVQVVFVVLQVLVHFVALPVLVVQVVLLLVLVELLALHVDRSPYQAFVLVVSMVLAVLHVN